MKNKFLFSIISLILSVQVFAHIPKNLQKPPMKSKTLSTRNGSCAPATKQIDQEINNVRARLLNGGDVWWDLNRGRYVVPKIEAGSGKLEVSSLYAGGVWVGGYDPAGALKFMGQTYRRSTENDCWPGPLMDNGETCAEDCLNWDQFFKVSGENITKLKKAWATAQKEGRSELNRSEIPLDILYWPAKGNPYFEARYGFKLPDARQGLALFDDLNFNKTFEPQFGEYPIIDIRGCPLGIFPDEMIFWIYNDAGGIHTNTQGDPIRMEVQVQTFAFRTADELNDMTFQRYKLINRAPQDIRDCYFAMWIDPDLGCYSDDYVGCDTTLVFRAKDSAFRQRDLMYIYNIDASDGSNGCTCERSVNTYCNNIPILGVDYFRGPLDENGNELGMTYFMYYNGRGLGGNPPPNTTDPTTSQEFYNYITGKWKDGSPLTVGGNGYNPGSTNVTRYAFPGAPNNQSGWSMCSTNGGSGAGEGDRRTIQASGPLVLQPGAVNELIIGVPWVPDQVYPCPSLDELLKADQLCQDLFDNCFKLKDGPTAPDVDFVELDQEIIILLSNDPSSNNFNEGHEEAGLGVPPGRDAFYRFEGYRIFQMSGPDVSLSDKSLNDPSLVREIFTVDVKNKIKKVYNWDGLKNPNPSTTHPIVYYPVEKVSGLDEGVRHSFSVKDDAFATGINNSLINHKKYYFLVVAYSYNNYEDFNPKENTGQRVQYCLGRLNVGPNGDGKPYGATPRPQIYELVNSKYGEGLPITRLDGHGAGNSFLRLAEGMHDKILNGSFNGVIDYQAGSGPIEVKVVNPLKVQNGEYELKFVDALPNNGKLDEPVTWSLKNIADPAKVIESTSSINKFNEQIIAELGISVGIVQTGDAGSDPLGSNGIIESGLEQEYKDPNGTIWFLAQPDNNGPFTDFIKTALGPNTLYNLDPQDKFANLGDGNINGAWYPYRMVTGDTLNFTPAWMGGFNKTIVSSIMKLDSLNNVDIVFTSDKSKWSRCVVLESWNSNNGSETEPTFGLKNFGVKQLPSVGKNDADGDGYADPDGALDNSGKPLTGMGWFPGYAIDAETGKRLNIFFSENSFYSTENALIQPCLKNQKGVGNDLMWNPTDQIFADASCGLQGFLNLVFGGHHYIYVTKQKYDSCTALRTRLSNPTNTNMSFAIREITWCTMPLMFTNTSLLPLGNGSTGLIPNDVTFRLRVDNPYQVSYGTNENFGHNLYRFKIDGKQAGLVSTKEAYENALEDVNVVPNPYYGFSNYESGQFSNVVKITNVPPKCQVTIYSIDGKFIKEYNRDEKPVKIVGGRGITERQIGPDIEWDLTNFRGIPVSSGAYLIYIRQPDTGAERIVKWFGVARKFDPSGL